MDNRMLTAEGLKNLFWGEIIAICAVIPLLGTIAGIVGMVLSILGFVKLSRVSSLYQMAFAFEVSNLVVSCINAVVDGGFLGSALQIASSLLGLAVVYYVCKGTAEQLQGITLNLMQRAHTIWILYLVSTIVMIACILFLIVPFVNLAAALLMAIMAIVQLVAGVMYLVFIWNSYKTLA